MNIYEPLKPNKVQDQLSILSPGPACAIGSFFWSLLPAVVFKEPLSKLSGKKRRKGTQKHDEFKSSLMSISLVLRSPTAYDDSVIIDLKYYSALTRLSATTTTTTNKQTNEQTNERTNERTNKQTNKQATKPARQQASKQASQLAS